MALRRVTASPKVFVDPHKAQDMHYGDSSLRCAVGAVQRVGIGGAREPAFFRCTSSLRRKWCVCCGTPRRGCKYFTLAKKEAPSALRVHSGVDLRFVANLSFGKRDVG